MGRNVKSTLGIDIEAERTAQLKALMKMCQHPTAGQACGKIGRASCRERV